jgi:hypothetical protein
MGGSSLADAAVSTAALVADIIMENKSNRIANDQLNLAWDQF